MQGPSQHNKLLLFQVGPVKCCLFSNDILTIIPPPRQETAGRAGRLPGMFRHNNRIARVVDMRDRFGLSPSSPERGKLILAELPKGLTAFWVDQIINVIDQEEGRWDALPPKLPREVFTRTFILEEELILHTEPARMEAMSPSVALRELIEDLEQKAQARQAERTPAEPQTAPPRAPATAPSEKEPEQRSRIERPAIATATAAAAAGAETKTVQVEPRPRTGERPDKPAPNRPVPERPVTPPAESATVRPTERRHAPAPGTAESRSKKTATAGERGETPPPRGTRETGETQTALAKPSPGRQDREPATVSARRPVTSATERTRHESAPVPGATPPSPPPPPEPEEGGMGWVALLMLLLFLGGSGALLYFSGILGERARPEPPVARYEVPTRPEPPARAEPRQTPPPAAEEPTPQAPAETGEPGGPAEAGETVAAREEASDYRAAIEKRDKVITITLEGPREPTTDESLLKEEATSETGGAAAGPMETEAPEEPVAEAEPASATEAEPEPEPVAESEVEPESESEAEPAPKPEPAPKKPERRITHVVVKGDTLWDIAERYVKDPFRYPELARLSDIDNPDRIYPGDVVVIIER